MSERLVHVYFDYRSPFAHMASEVLPSFAERNGLTLRWMPIHLQRLSNFAEGLPYSPKKRAYVFVDAQRQAEYHGVKIRIPKPFPVEADLALRVSLLAEKARPVRRVAAGPVPRRLGGGTGHLGAGGRGALLARKRRRSGLGRGRVETGRRRITHRADARCGRGRHLRRAHDDSRRRAVLGHRQSTGAGVATDGLALRSRLKVIVIAACGRVPCLRRKLSSCRVCGSVGAA